MLHILLCFDQCESVAQSLVVDDSCVANTLLFAENSIGKQESLPPDLEGPVREVVKLDVLACDVLRNVVSLQDDLLAVIVEGELRPYISLLAMAGSRSGGWAPR
jgi:hypothetical protein